MAAGSAPVDARADRVVQGIVAVVAIGAFVFHQPWSIPVLTLALAAGAGFGPRGNPFHRAFAAFVAPRISPATSYETSATIRAQDVLAAALLGTATPALVIGLGGIAWIIALAEAGIAAIAATTGVHLGVVVRDRIRRRR